MLNKKIPLKRTKQGFTLVEMLVVAPLVILLIGGFISAIVSMTGAVIASRGSSALAVNIQDALNRIDLDVRSSVSYLATNSITPLTTQGYNNDSTGFTSVGTNGTMLILSSNATTGNPLNLSINTVYRNTPNACSSLQVSANTPITYNIVYFVKNNTLWRRVIMPSDYRTASCVNGSSGLPWQRPSCAVSTGVDPCISQDEKLVDGIQSGGFTINYYSSAVPNTPIVGATNSDPVVRLAAMQTASSIKASITSTNTYAGRDITQSGVIRSISPNVSTPLAPGTLSGVAGGGGTSIALTWSAPSGSAAVTGYYVYRGSTSGNETLLTTLGNVLTYTDTSVTSGNTYWYKIAAYNSLGTGGYGNEISVTTSSSGSYPFSYTGAVVSWPVPAGVTSITITAKGAQGGQYTSVTVGGLGASVKGTFTVTPGDTLWVLVGQHPPTTSSFPAGGGGSFVGKGATLLTSTPLLAAGGGGGSYSNSNPGQGGQILNVTTTGNGGGTAPGTNGSGAPTTSCGGGGGGFYSNGGNDSYYPATGLGGKGFQQGGVSTTTVSGYQTGAVGGGAYADYVGTCNTRAGAGGGYSGGSGQSTTIVVNAGAGGGSFNGGTNQTNTAATQSGDGSVVIAWGS